MTVWSRMPRLEGCCRGLRELEIISRIRALESLSKLDRDLRANRSQDPAEVLQEQTDAINWFHALIRFAFDEMKTNNLEFDDFQRRVSARVLETNPVVAKPGGNGAQQVPERAEEVADAAAG